MQREKTYHGTTYHGTTYHGDGSADIYQQNHPCDMPLSTCRILFFYRDTMILLRISAIIFTVIMGIGEDNEQDCLT
jgi:hypothetical protein